MARNGDVIGWLLSEQNREALLAQIAPRYAEVVAHHVTLKADAGPDDHARPPLEAQVVGEADDGEGVQALVVRLDGTTDRPDGSTYHITWSLEPGRRAVESNDVIASKGWARLEPLLINLIPGRF